jgi:lysophospholipase L1-like esterase
MLLMSLNHKKKRKRIVFFGDSITEQGNKPGGYIKRIWRILRDEGIDDDYELVAAGVSGDKVYDLYLRRDEAILAKGADIVVIFIGTNDVWHKFSHLTGTDETTFKTFYNEMIQKLLSVDMKVVVCTPALIGENILFLNKENEELENYADIVRALAAENNLPLVDARMAFINYVSAHNFENKAQGIVTRDGVHLNDAGNQLMAEEMWKVLREIKK